MCPDSHSSSVRVRVAPRPSWLYQVRIGLEGAAATALWVAEHFPGWRVAVLTEEPLMSLARALVDELEKREMDARVFSFGGGEERKTRSQKRELENSLLSAGYSRDTLIVAVGGGVTCDLAGFIAATYYRGIPWVAFPTSLLAMVDAAVGGKTAVNTPHGKNLVGAYHHPSFVYCDTGVLDSLPEREIRSGLAEVAKAAFLEGEVRMSRLRELAPKLLEGDAEAYREIIEAAVRLKAKVVEEDDADRDYRQVLNLGHTIGHAVEVASGYGLRHGEAMAIGMVMEARLAEAAGIGREGLAAEISRLLENLGLPVTLPRALDPKKVLGLLVHDKKVRRGRPRFALLEQPGRPHMGPEGWAVNVDEDLVREIVLEGEESGGRRS